MKGLVESGSIGYSQPDRLPSDPESTSSFPVHQKPAISRRPANRQSTGRFLYLILFWTLTVVAVAILKDGLDYLKTPGGFGPLLDRIAHDLTRSNALMLLTCVLIGLGLGATHYLVARAVSSRGKEPLRAREITGAIAAVVVLSAVPAFLVVRQIREHRLIRDTIQLGLDDELQAIHARGDYRGVVRRMEEACDVFAEARRKRGARFRASSPGGHGLSYLFTTLFASNEETFCSKLPRGLVPFLYEASVGESDPPPPEHCAPLAKEMAASRIPTLRILGHWLLDDREAFATEVYARIAAGDADFQKMEYFTASSVDPVPHRALPRLVRIVKSGRLDKVRRVQTPYWMYRHGTKALAGGQASAGDLAYARKIALEHSYRLDFGRLNREPVKYKWERAFLGLDEETAAAP